MSDETTSGFPVLRLAEESDAIKVLARGDDGIADMFAYQAGAADDQNVLGGGHSRCLVVQVEWRWLGKCCYGDTVLSSVDRVRFYLPITCRGARRQKWLCRRRRGYMRGKVAPRHAQPISDVSQERLLVLQLHTMAALRIPARQLSFAHIVSG
jgi:hypothetical protein